MSLPSSETVHPFGDSGIVGVLDLLEEISSKSATGLGKVKKPGVEGEGSDEGLCLEEAADL